MLEGLARQVVTDLNTFFSKDGLERSALEHERLRLARELHDGVLQSLTGVALRLRALSKLVEDYPKPVRDRLLEVEEMMLTEQRELRVWIEGLRPMTRVAMATRVDIVGALTPLCNRFSRWGLRVELKIPEHVAIPRSLGDQIYRLVQEGLSNASRHAFAHLVRVELTMMRDKIGLVMEDDGCGFQRRGRYDLEKLNAQNWGPVSIKERVAAMRGDLVLTSTISGSRIEITLPNQPTALQGSHVRVA